MTSKIPQSHKYDYQIDNTLDSSYSIIIDIRNDEIVFNVSFLGLNNILERDSLIYEGSFNITSLIEKNRYFQIFDSLDELVEFFDGIIKSKKLNIIHMDNENILRIQWIFPKGYKSTDELNLLLKKKKLKKNSTNSTNNTEIDQLKHSISVITEKYENKIQNYKSQITIKDNQIIQFKKQLLNKDLEIKNLNKDVIELRQSLNKLIGNLHNYNPLLVIENIYGLSSSIIKYMDEVDYIKSWINSNVLINSTTDKQKKGIKFSLLYKGTRDSDKANTFHYIVKDKSPTITLIRTKKNRRFGGYTERNWNVENEEGKEDKNAFLFSLDNKKKYCSTQFDRAIKSCEYSIINFNSYVKSNFDNKFDYGDLYVYENYFIEGGYENKCKYSYKMVGYELSEEEQFQISEIEVYLVIFY